MRVFRRGIMLADVLDSIVEVLFLCRWCMSVVDGWWL